MQDLLRVADAGGVRDVVLPRGLVTIGAESDCTIQLQRMEPGENLRSLQWDARRATWQLLRGEGPPEPLNLNGRQLDDAELVTLNHLDVLEAPGVQMQFCRILDEPVFRGEPAQLMVLDAAPLVLGVDKEQAGGPSLIRLDPEDPFISRAHASITRDGEHYWLEDLSTTGTELNGAAFHRERLVFGDRFRISGYLFEFIGTALQYIRPELSGALAARRLMVQIGRRCILEGVSLNVAAGEFIGVLGRSGQGKSTLLNALCGVHPASSGQVTLGGVPIEDRERLRSIGVGYVPQDDIVHRELTVWQAIHYSARLRVNLPSRQLCTLAERVISQLDLGAHQAKRVEQLSGGQRKRVSIAIELLAKPNVLFLDEPSSGLDPATEAELMTLLQSLTLTKLTVVCTTHVLHKSYLFDRMLVIEGGRLIFAGRSDEARAHFLLGADHDDLALEGAPLERIYTLLQNTGRTGEKTAEQWEEEFRQSSYAARALPPLPEAGGRLPAAAAQRRVGAWRVLTTLIARQAAILRSDSLNVLFLLAQPMLIALALGWVANNSAQRFFLCVVATMWFGCSNGAQQIVGERPVFRRERVCGQSLHAYLLSKISFLSAISLAQALLLLLTVLGTTRLLRNENAEDAANLARSLAARLTPLVAAGPAEGGEHFEVVGGDSPRGSAPPPAAPPAPPPAPVEPSALRVRALASVCTFFEVSQNVLDTSPGLLKRSDGTALLDAAGRQILLPGLPVLQVLGFTIGLRLLALAAATITSVCIGLAISALVKNATQAVLWVPLVLIPQILFGGILIAVPEMSRSVWLFSHAVPSFSAQRIMDSAALFGLETPAMSNRTKVPLFLSPLGDKDSLEWAEGGEHRSQDYDLLSPVNASWQNLLTLRERMGQHKWEQEAGGDQGKVYPDSVQRRRDVTLHKGTPFRDLSFARRALLALTAWGALCYATMVTGLVARPAR